MKLIKFNIYKEIVNEKWWDLKSFFTKLKDVLASDYDASKNSLIEKIIKNPIGDSGNNVLDYIFLH